MDNSTSRRKLTKRSLDDDMNIERSRKKALVPVKIDDVDAIGIEKTYRFRVLFPNGKSVEVKVNRIHTEMPMVEFVNVVKEKYETSLRQSPGQMPRRSINWKSRFLHFIDASDKQITCSLDLSKFELGQWNLLRLQDGSGETDTYENMWDLMPDTDLLMELPAEYTFEAALADLIDNALQAVWSNGPDEKKLISVEVLDKKITVLDNGPGMDHRSLDKWGKMGASLHRSSRKKAIGGKTPYLTPFFGMFGYGGAIASMHLGKAVVSSKTKDSKKVCSLVLDREALIRCSRSEHPWKVDGCLRDPSEEELINFPNGSFMKIEILEPKVRVADVSLLQSKLKDVYFPYIQCDEESSTRGTLRHVEFQVNGTDLAEVDGGEVAVTNFNSCNGDAFTFQLYFTEPCSNTQGIKVYEEANAQLKCVYFPVVQGKETIDKILEKLEEDGYALAESYDNFSHISIRRLGRLLPDARWKWLPFMDLRQKKGDKKAQLLKRCCSRVKCFIETDAGFNPTPSKTDLAHHHPYTTALKNFGSRVTDHHKEVNVEIFKEKKQMSLHLLHKKYEEWILQMHDRFDEEIECGEDKATYVVGPQIKKELGISADVLRIHKAIKRKGIYWESGQKIKVLKGACAGCHKTNVFVTLEYIALGGWQGDAGGEARLICRPIGVPDVKGCLFTMENETAIIKLCDSISIPLSVIDSGKCIAVGDDEWQCKLDKRHQGTPSSIELLRAEECKELEIDMELPVKNVCAGHKIPEEIVAVIRPAGFDSENASQSLNQKYIVKEHNEMSLEITFKAKDKDRATIYSAQVTPSSLKGIQGLYRFSMKEMLNIFEKAGLYTFVLSLKEVSCKACERKVQVEALTEARSWKILRNDRIVKYTAVSGSCFPPLSFGCYDRYCNRILFKGIPEVMIKFSNINGVSIHTCNKVVSLSRDKSTMTIQDLRVVSGDLDNIRPKYETKLLISPSDESFSVSIPCQVLPGALEHVIVQPQDLQNQLLPGHIIKELKLEMFDMYGNHLKQNEDVKVQVDGISFLDKRGCNRKVDYHGFVNLSDNLKVTKGYGETAILDVLHGDKLVLKKVFHIEKRELRTSFEVPIFCTGSSQLENLVFVVTTSEGELDENIHDKDENGNSHTLTLRSDKLDIDDSVQYVFRHGRSTVRSISLPNEKGVFSFTAAHSCHPELQLSVEVHVEHTGLLGLGNITPKNLDEMVRQDLPALITSKQEYQDLNHENAKKQLQLVPTASSYNLDVLHLITDTILNEQKGFEDDVHDYGNRIGKQEKYLKSLKYKQLFLEEDLSRLQASVCHDCHDHKVITSQKKIIMEKIYCKCNTAAAMVYKLLRSQPSEKRHREFADNILGVVALLGNVQSEELSRIFSQYLGEDQMLAVVCKTYSAARAFEKYELNDFTNVLNELASKFRCSLNRRYVVMCLEDVRSYHGPLGRDAQRKLVLLDPTLPDGMPPVGYMGYAVNMIQLDAGKLQWRNAAGQGLRETLFYCLFGELQVYENRECMNKAISCIKEGAVSLDGGIVRRNTLMSLGRWEPDIQFPVLSFEPCGQEEIERIDKELHKISSQVEQEEKILEKIKKKFQKRRERYSKFLDEKTPLISILHGLPISQVACSSSSGFAG